MKLFHGTSYKSGNTILKQGLIKKGQSAFDLFTDSNYVYLTNRITVAMNYGRKKAVFSEPEEEQFYLFEIELNKDLLLVDLDEVAIFKDGFMDQKAAIKKLNGQYTLENTLPLFHSVRVNFDIALYNYNGKYSTLSNKDITEDINEDIFDKNLSDQDLQKIYDSITWYST
ncbi:hypothetical protein COJ27_26080 [Bacillus cereus]|uniref:hypothetical protein n=1 Tax=Bacillus cereus TaxID=1396 RepID=UPI000BF82F65|nr:hypothetical protein [Bacillus cereus]PFL58917.1 hypothetical protein COJ27_26080 [Bacillus cereus]